MKLEEAQTRARMIRRQAGEDQANPPNNNVPRWERVASPVQQPPIHPPVPFSPIPVFSLPVFQLPPISVGPDNLQNYNQKTGTVPQRRVIPPSPL